uniref:Retrovirus-related Pol polyprotein from transposon TNT 1-94 n=1 Tax=Vitis vinifera TaxID=29760 RepID=A5AGE9_VITVI|nr:hypothetical protein VITISV_036064 [Vitis vinifera]
MAFGRQLHQAEGQFRTMEIKVRIPQSTVRKFRTPQIKVVGVHKWFLKPRFCLKSLRITLTGQYMTRLGIESPSVSSIVKGDRFNLNQCPKNDLEKEQMKNIPYASTFESLMYAQVCTRPDIAFVVGMLGRYQSNPGIDHWKVAKKVMRYLQGTKDYKLMYRRTSNLEVVGYSDSDFAGCVD